MKRIAVIGGGVSGLAAACELEKKIKNGAELEYVIFEASSRFGGVLQTENIDDFAIEAGPDSFLTEKTSAADLCRELGLGNQLISSNDGERKTYILVKGRLVPLPDGLMFMVPTKIQSTLLSPLFPWTTKLRMLAEWFYRPPSEVHESTVAKFVQRHYGREMVERLADPLLAGVYGGSADELSANAVLPRLVELEAKYGSLGRGMVALRKVRREKQSSIFTSLRNGMQEMSDAMLSRIPEAARRPNAPVQSVAPESGKWLVVSNERTEEFDGVVFALPAYVCADLLQSSAPQQFSSDLRQIPYSSSVTVALAYDEDIRVPPGFGFLVPRSEGKRILACTFVHQKFAGRAPGSKALLRCFLGGSRDEQILHSTDKELEAIVRRELGEILGLSATPLFTRIYRWPKAIAQYLVGHKAIVDRIKSMLSEVPGLALAGNAYGGIGIPDCLRSGSEAAMKVLSDFAITSPRARVNQ